MYLRIASAASIVVLLLCFGACSEASNEAPRQTPTALSPEATVRGWYAALKADKPKESLAFLVAAERERFENEAAEAESKTDDEKVEIEAFEVVSVETNGDRAVVTVSVTRSGERGPSTRQEKMVALREDGKWLISLAATFEEAGFARPKK